MAQTAMGDYSSPNKNIYASSGRIDMTPTPKLERNSESMPRLMGGAANADNKSRKSGYSGMHNRLNQSMDLIKPRRADGTLMKMAGSNILGNNSFN